MKKFVKSIVIAVVTISSLVAIALFVCNLKPIDIKAKAGELKEYCIKNGYNTDYAILADYGRFSMQKRLFVYDFKQEKVIFKTLSGHGSGGESTLLMADFSNAHGSHCSSLGHYKIGRHRHMYNRPAVPAFELIGLDKTNSNALDRGILIHPSVGPLSWGCVTLPLYRYHQLSEFLKTQRNVILWLYE